MRARGAHRGVCRLRQRQACTTVKARTARTSALAPSRQSVPRTRTKAASLQ